MTIDSTAVSRCCFYSLFPRDRGADVKVCHSQRSFGDPLKDLGVGSFVRKKIIIKKRKPEVTGSKDTERLLIVN